MGDSYSWNGGSGDFSDPTQWTDETNPANTGVDAPGADDEADFDSGGSVTGSGDVAYIFIDSTVGFMGDFTAQQLQNYGVLSVTSGSLNVTTYGLADSGEVDVSGGASLTLSNSDTSLTSLALGNGYDGTVFTVSGSGSSVTTSNGGVDVGVFGGGTLSVLDGATFTASEGSAEWFSIGIGKEDGDDGTVIVDGAGSMIELQNQGMVVGNAGTGTLTVSDAGSIVFDAAANNILVLGQLSTGGGTVTVTGAGSSIYDNDVIYVGAGGQGVMTVENNGTVTSEGIEIGAVSGGTGSAIVMGPALWNVIDGAAIHVGDGGTGTMLIQNGGTVTDSAGRVDVGVTTGGVGTLTIEDSDSKLIAGALYIGGSSAGPGGTGTVVVRDGGSVMLATDMVGYYGTGTVDGSGSTLSIGGDATLAHTGTLNFVVSNHGSMDVTNDVTIGEGTTGVGTLSIIGGGQVTIGGSLDIGAGQGTQGTVIADGDGSILGVTGTVTVGDAGTGTLSVGASAFATAAALIVAGQTTSGTAAMPDVVTANGAGAMFIVSGDATVDEAMPTPTNGNGDADGTDGIWVYTNSGIGQVYATNGGYISIGQTLTLLAPGDLTLPAVLKIDTGGGVEVGGNTGLVANTLQVDANGRIVGHGEIDSAVTGMIPVGTVAMIPTYAMAVQNMGTIEVMNGTMDVHGDVFGNGVFQVDGNSTLELAGGFDDAGTVAFSGTDPHTLVLDNAYAFHGTITGMDVGDQVVFRDTSLANGDGVIAATIGTLNGAQTLQVLLGPANDPSDRNDSLVNIPIEGIDNDGTLNGDYIQVTQNANGDDTTLTLTQGNPVDLSVDGPTARADYGVDGAGITIGVISDSFNSLGGEQNDIDAGALPGDIDILGDGGGTDEGRAMAQIIHDIAPGAAIDFDTGNPGPQGTANAIDALAAAGCDIIVDDLGWGVANEPTGGVIDQAIDAAYGDGITYVTAAGNDREMGIDIYGHSADPDALTVAAMNLLATPSVVGGYIDPQTEPFSSIGADDTKPDITGPDGGPTTFDLPPGSGLSPFFGTSAAAPAVAAVAALMMDENSALITRPGVVDQLLEESAFDFGEAPNMMGAGFVQAPGAVGLAADFVACFAAGTLILTDRGEIPVERLRVGDKVRTPLSDSTAPIVWIGHRRVNCTRHPDPRQVWPVRVRAGAFGDNMPRRDLWLSPDHAVYVNEVLIPVKYLINHSTIARVAVDAVTYFHVELPRHDVLLAEGLPAESYLDAGDRRRFSNGGDVIGLFPDFASRSADVVAIWEAFGRAPLVVNGPVLDAVRRRLAARAAAADRVRPSVTFPRATPP